jgi:hypothetical protein
LRANNLLAVRDVDELQTPTRFQDTHDFSEDPALVGAQVDDAVANDDIGRAVLERQVLDHALPELDIAQTHRGRRGARSTEHFLGHVDAHDAAFRPDLNSRLPLAMPVVFEFGSGARKTERGPLVMPSHVGVAAAMERKSGSHRTHRWRKADSNHRSRPTGGAFEAAPCWFRRTSEPASNPPWRARNTAFGLWPTRQHPANLISPIRGAAAGQFA